MNYIEVIGGNKFQKQTAEKVVQKMIETLMPRMRTLEITVNIKKLTGDAVGWCMMEDTNRDFTIDVHNKLTLKDFVTTICHEMVHVKQFARRETCGYGVKWKGKKITPKTPYYDLPWEKEAYKMQDKLAQIVWDADVL
jgi:hypothetical protein